MMMTKFRTFALTLAIGIFSLSFSFGQAEEYFNESEEKATVYIIRTPKLGALINFRYFIGETYIGKCNYGKYFKVYLTPGKHLIWSKSENRSFIEAEVEAGKTYVINAIPKMGGFRASVKLEELDTNFTEGQLKRFKKYFEKRAKLITFTPEELAIGQEKFADVIVEGLAKYEKVKGKEKEIPVLKTPIDLEAILK
ncbi:hypothetical protein ACFQ1M_00445 [Sungkyunkwania multivorans]|uniref:DUF2846 domain-containing protein n=1 Tax=Sungkyunkwania multivorans TaxID=1173618 RepID=A0ABW3CVP3_9FLAO